MNKLKNVLIYTIIFFMPFMSVVNVFNVTRFNLSLSDILLPIVAIYSIINTKDINFKIIKKYIIIFILLFIALLLSGLLAINNNNIISGNITALLSEEVKVIICAVYFIMIVIYVDNKEAFKNTLKVWLISSICMCIIGIFSLIMYYQGKPIEINTLVSGSKSTNVFIGTFTDQNLCAVYLSISFYIALLYFKLSKYKYEKVVSIIAIILSPICIFLTASRGGIIGFSCSIIFYGIIAFKYLYKKFIIIIPIILLIVMSGLAIDIAFMGQDISNKMFEKMQQVTDKNGEFIVRGNLSKVAFEMGNDHILLGVGRGNYPLNSSQYFKNIGLNPHSYEYENKIPHNTILGIYSELGIIGLILYGFVFIYLLYIIIRNLKYKEYRNYQYIIIAMYACIFAESIPLNIENFRGLWIITALCIILQENLTQYIDVKKEKSFKLNYKYICIGLVIFAISFILYFDNARKLNIPQNILVKDKVDINIKDFEKSKNQYVSYYISSNSDSPNNISVKISIISIDTNNNEKVLSEYKYWKTSGIAKLYFEPDKYTKNIILRVYNYNKSYNVTINNINLVVDEIEKGVINEYPLLTDNIYDFLNSKNLIHREKSKQVFQNSDIWNEKLNYNFSDRVILKSVNNEIVDGKYKLIFVFDCIGKIEYNYLMWLHGSVDNINYLNSDRIQYGYDNFDHEMEIPMSTWEIGKEYIHEFVLPIDKGIYNLTFGFYLDGNRLYIDNNENNAGIYIGEIDTGKY